jgi:peptidoglycan/xylan/chitin deacetylase (PgdA/CDA1 family)
VRGASDRRLLLAAAREYQAAASLTFLGLTEVLWTVDSRDWAGASTDEIVQAASRLQPGGIILIHDGGYQTTIDAVPRMLSGLASRGLCPGKIVYTPADTSP